MLFNTYIEDMIKNCVEENDRIREMYGFKILNECFHSCCSIIECGMKMNVEKQKSNDRRQEADNVYIKKERTEQVNY